MIAQTGSKAQEKVCAVDGAGGVGRADSSDDGYRCG